MNPNKKNQLLRLSAVLYADNNYDVSSKTTLKKNYRNGTFCDGKRFRKHSQAY